MNGDSEKYHRYEEAVKKEKTFFINLNATRVVATTIGVFFGLFSGVNHGFFEFLQGNTPTDDFIINAIGEVRRFWPAGTEPAFTLIPNFMITGILSMIVCWQLQFGPSGSSPAGTDALFFWDCSS